MKNLINIFIGNHNKIESISDHINLLKKILSNKDMKVVITKKILLNGINLIIEDFSEKRMKNELIYIKKNHPKTSYICLFTELPTKNIFKNYNQTNLNIFYEIIIYFDNFYKIIKEIYYNFLIFLIKSLWPIKIWFLKKKFLWKKSHYQCIDGFKNKKNFKSANTEIVIKKSKKSKFLNYLRMKYHNYCYWKYMKSRLFSSLNFKNYIDVNIDMHPVINNELNRILNITSLTLFPEINTSFFLRNRKIKSKYEIVSTGSLNLFRKRNIENYNDLLKSKGYKITYQSFLSDRQLRKYSYNFNSPQSEEWSYSSPIRFMRSINNGQIPIIIKKFADHPIESLGFHLKKTQVDKFDINILKFKKNILKNLNKYNVISKKYNDLIKIKILDNYQEGNSFYELFSVQKKSLLYRITEKKPFKFINGFMIYDHNNLFYAITLKDLNKISLNEIIKNKKYRFNKNYTNLKSELSLILLSKCKSNSGIKVVAYFQYNVIHFNNFFYLINFKDKIVIKKFKTFIKSIEFIRMNFLKKSESLSNPYKEYKLEKSIKFSLIE